MTSNLPARLVESVAGTPLAPRLAAAAAPLAEGPAGDSGADVLTDGVLLGLARALATRPELAAFLSHRPALLERLARLDANSLTERERALLDETGVIATDDLEAELDTLRLLRREETLLAACVDFGEIAPFEAVSTFLSILAEAILERALRLAEAGHEDAAALARLSVIGMGKIAGREFTYHSDLDVIFLAEGGVEEVHAASRIGQRLISYLTTMTGAGSAYAVDTRLRPSGQKGALVTSRKAYERYQRERAELWEHLALLRARAVAGNRAPAQACLDQLHRRVVGRYPDPWPYLADLRERVVRERSDPAQDEIHYKTGPGGLMDVDFLAGGALLQRTGAECPALPSVPAMLRAAGSGGRIETLIEDYRFLRRVESRVRWVAGRGVETFLRRDESLASIAELVRSGLTPGDLLDEVAAARARIRDAYDAVIGAGAAAALGV